MSGQYDPRSAAFALRDTIRRHTPVIKSSNVPGLVNEHGTAYPTPEPAPQIEGICVLISVLTEGNDGLPLDLVKVERSRDALKSHVRPDGGVFLGFFGSSPDDATIVYGDPLTTHDDTKRIVLDFWQRQGLV